MRHVTRSKRNLADGSMRGLLSGAVIAASAAIAPAQVVDWLDPYEDQPRQIPDLAGGGFVTLTEDQIIDVVVLGDGFENSASERGAFFREAQDWYDTMLLEADGSRPNGIRPYHLF